MSNATNATNETNKKGPAQKKQEKEICSICADIYTPVLRRKISCKFCSKDACTKCIEQYLLGRPEDAHCIHCRVNYSDIILKSICTRTYLQQTYFRHRQEILMSRERANLPALQDAAQRVKRRRDHARLISQMSQEVDHMKQERMKFIEKISHSSLQLSTHVMENADKKQKQGEYIELLQQEKEIVRTIRWKQSEILHLRRSGFPEEKGDGADGANGAGEEKEEKGGDEKEEKGERKKFIRRCMKANCQGFLSTAWKCGICENYSCGKCFTVKGPAHDTPHTCKKEDLETADMIRADSKPCPNCGEFINKSSGCFAKDTPILLWDGTTKMSQDIQVSDQLVGDDGRPRTVQALIDGVEELYEVSQTNGLTYVVNGGHTLVLSRRDGIHEMTVHDYMALPATIQMALMGYKIAGYKIAGYKMASPIEESHLSVKPVGLGEFYGWKVDGNHRFLLKDGTCLRNCSQIWCVTCKTPWDWNTGKIVTKGVIHNPHYYEWLRRNGGEMPRNPADVPCGGFPGAHELRRLNHHVGRGHSHYFYEFHRLCMEVQEQSERTFRSHIDQEGFQDTHVRFLIGDVEEKEWGRRLAITEKRRKRDAEVQEVFAAFRMVAVELINRIQNYRDESVDAITLLPRRQAEAYLEKWHEEASALIDMVNQGMKDISLSYGCTVPRINVINSNVINSILITYRLISHKWVGVTKRKARALGPLEPLEPLEPYESSSESEEDEDDDEDDNEVLRHVLEKSIAEQ